MEIFTLWLGLSLDTLCKYSYSFEERKIKDKVRLSSYLVYLKNFILFDIPTSVPLPSPSAPTSPPSHLLFTPQRR